MPDHIIIILQARMESTRYPGKLLARLCGQPLILWALDRLAKVAMPHTLVVAMPATDANIVLHDLCERHGYSSIMIPGDANDVLKRFAIVSKMYGATQIVRICGDVPLVDPQMVSDVIHYHFAHNAEATHLAPEWGDGFDVEAFTAGALYHANIETTVTSEREHIGPAFYHHPERFTLATYRCPFDLSWMRLSVDTSADLALVETVLQDSLALGYGLSPSWRDLVAICSDPRIKRHMQERPINQAYVDQVAAERGGEPMAWQRLRYGDA